MFNRFNVSLALGLIFNMIFTQLTVAEQIKLTDEQVENIVRRTYQYVAMYNVNNKFALTQGGWNTIVADTALKDHTMRDIARPNNDTLYIGAMLDLRAEPMILDVPSFDSEYVSLMVTGYDHYVNVPMSVTMGHFDKQEKILLYSANTKNYDGEKIDGIDHIFKASGDFISAIFRVMPHSAEKERSEYIIAQMNQVKLFSLSEFFGKDSHQLEKPVFPDVGETDVHIYTNNFLEVMQFVVNHTSFDEKNEMDNELLDALKPLGITPGNIFDPANAAQIETKQFGRIVNELRENYFAKAMDPATMERSGLNLFQIKGQISLDDMILQSVIGPIGLPADEAVYPALSTKNGEPMNALHDYVIHMSAGELPPAEAFWSMTLYDSANGFFIPNDHMKYSVGKNGGMKLNQKGGLSVYVAADLPDGVPPENWLPMNRQDENLDIILRIYVPDLKRFRSWSAPVVELIK